MHSRIACLVASVIACAFAAPAARAEWPDHSIRWIVPFGPGGANDLIPRVIVEELRKGLGQPIVIENRPGAGAVVGTVAVANSAPDGYTFLVSANGVVTNSMLIKNLPYTDAQIVPVARLAVAPSVIVVHPSVPANNLEEFVAWAKSQGDKGVNWATAGSGSTPHFVAEMLKEATGIKLNIIPYKSGNDGVTAVLSNSVSATSEASIVVLPQIKAGLLKPIATTYEKRVSADPSILTAAEQGYPTVQIGHWAGLFAPRGTPEPILRRMHAEIQIALKSPGVRAKLAASGIETNEGSIEDFLAFIARERARLGALVVKAKMGDLQQ